jgi:phospholipase C
MPSLPGYRSLPRRVTVSIAAILMTSTALTPTAAVAQQSNTQTPIKHVIIIIGENRTFDHIFATYTPINKGEKVLNLLSKKIVNPDGTPGPNYGQALQY